MRSMTGYGRGENTAEGQRFVAELSSVNRRQNEVVVNLPKELVSLEMQIRDMVREKFSRGRTVINITLQRVPAGGDESDASQRVEINVGLARVFTQKITRLSDELKLNEPGTTRVPLEILLGLPGVLTISAPEIDAESAWPIMRPAIEGGLGELEEMRLKEGRFLVKDVRKRLIFLVKQVQRISTLKWRATERYRTNLKERLRTAGVDLMMDEERLRKEVMIFADRCDISEELIRLESHFEQFATQLEEGGSIGRKLEFLTQELVREFNTLSVKANDSEISQIVVDCKTEVEKIREQVQNLE